VQKIIIAAALVSMGAPALAQNEHWVQPHMTRNGEYVQGHMQTNPDGNPYNNWSTRGNVNPYTGQPGTVNPYQHEPARPYTGYNPADHNGF
jgi:hypothetical protein